METELPSRVERALVNGVVRLGWPSRSSRAWPVPREIPHRPVEIPSAQGVTLAASWFPVEGRVRGVVVLAHPDRRYGRHWFVREGWIPFLRAHGYEALTFDFPGYGATRGPRTYHHEHVESAARFARDWAGGLPVHVVGLSLGAFAAANASPRLDFVESLVLESPYPSFREWYGRGPGERVMRVFERAFPRSAALLRADRNLARAQARRILVALAEEDEVTPPPLTERMARAGPPDRTSLLRVPGARHLEPFARSEDYRERLLKTLG